MIARGQRSECPAEKWERRSAPPERCRNTKTSGGEHTLQGQAGTRFWLKPDRRTLRIRYEMLRTLILALVSTHLLAVPVSADPPRLRVFDAHLHAQSSSEGATRMLDAMKEVNVEAAVLIGTEADLEKNATWFAGSLPGLMLPCEDGRAANTGARCYADGAAWPDLRNLHAAIESGKVMVLGEVTAQYAGITPDSPLLEPYYALAEELDVPIGIHLGLGPPAVSYPGAGFPARKSPGYRGTAGDVLALEAVLVRHPKLRVYVMHAAWPFLDGMLYMLYMHPQLHVDLSVLQYAIPRAEYMRYLRTLVEAGFAKRMMFGSDGGAKQLLAGVAAIREATFLTEEQKADILFHNAVRFFRWKENTGKTAGNEVRTARQ
jgi:uncharacterized protein